MMRKNQIMICFLLMFVMAFTGCSINILNRLSKDTNGNTATDGVSLEAGQGLENDSDIYLHFSWWGSGARHEAMQEVIRLFQEANKGVFIIPQYQTWDSYGQDLLSELANGTEADIIQVNYNWIHSYGLGLNVFADLNQLTEYLQLDNWDSIYLDAMSTGGELSVVPWGMTGRVQLVNQVLFEQYGFGFPKTFSEVMEQGRVIDTKSAPVFLLKNIGSESLDLFIAQMLLNMTGLPMQTNGTVNYSVEQVVEVFEWIQALEEIGAMPTIDQEADVQNENNPDWIEGQVGAVYEWSSALDKYVDSFVLANPKKELSIGDVIRFEEEESPCVYVKPNLGYAISRNSKHQELAAAFIEFMFTDPEAVAAMNTQLGLSSNQVTHALQNELGMIDGLTAEAIAILESHRQVVMDPFFEDYNVRNERQLAIEGFRTGEMDVEAAALHYIEAQQLILKELIRQ